MYIPADAKVLTTFPAEFKTTYSNVFNGDTSQYSTEISVIIPGPLGIFTDETSILHIAQDDGRADVPQVIALTKADAEKVIAALQAGVAAL
jgi:hypothetical protein